MSIAIVKGENANLYKIKFWLNGNSERIATWTNYADRDFFMQN